MKSSVDADGVDHENGDDVLVKSSDDITQTALITSTNGDVGLIATDEITQTCNGRHHDRGRT